MVFTGGVLAGCYLQGEYLVDTGWRPPMHAEQPWWADCPKCHSSLETWTDSERSVYRCTECKATFPYSEITRHKGVKSP